MEPVEQVKRKKIDNYQQMVEVNPVIERVVNEELVDRIFSSNERTVASLNPTWKKNTRDNLQLYRKHGSVMEIHRFGTGKLVIGVGAGPSFNLNKDVLRDIYKWNSQFPLEEQPFVIVATNKQFKPLLAEGIFPHFVMLVDAGDVLYPQLCEDIPRRARDSVLITGLHTSPRILRSWSKNGGHICFYSIGDEEDQKWLKNKIGEDAEKIYIQQGGNIMNTLWIVAGRFLGSYNFVAVGNDLSFKYSKSADERRKSFYADGDYRLSILNKRDDAQQQLAWMGINRLYESSIVPGNWMYDLDVMGTSTLLWTYKTWIEVQVTLWSNQMPFHYFNCSESGILGVLAKNNIGPDLYNKENWYLMDDLLPSHWHTVTLEALFNMVKQWKENQWLINAGVVTPTDVIAGTGRQRTATALAVDPLISGLTIH